MIEALAEKIEEPARKGPISVLSHSQIDRYLRCPEQYRLYYIEGLRLKVPKATLVFGSLLHEALAFFFKKRDDPVRTFLNSWSVLKDIDLQYSQKDSWQKLKENGEGLLEKFMQEEVRKIENVRAAEKRFKLNITGLELPFIGFIDLLSDLEGSSAIVEFKTSGSAYEGFESEMSDQLTAYKLAEPEVEQMALCVLIKTKKPKIEWHKTKRNSEQVLKYLAKVGYVAREIKAGRFYTRPGPWCSWCDFLPVCLGDEKKTEETLVKVK